MATKKAPVRASDQIDELVYRINTLLHTMRAIARHEDQLCTLMTEIRTFGLVNETLDQDLRDLLEQMPAHEYLDDVEAVRETLSPALLSPRPAASKPPRKRPVK